MDQMRWRGAFKKYIYLIKYHHGISHLDPLPPWREIPPEARFDGIQERSIEALIKEMALEEEKD